VGVFGGKNDSHRTVTLFGSLEGLLRLWHVLHHLARVHRFICRLDASDSVKERCASPLPVFVNRDVHDGRGGFPTFADDVRSALLLDLLNNIDERFFSCGNV
jgi:hypothetical protein